MILVAAAAAAGAFWLLNKEKPDEAAAEEVAQQEPVLSPSQKEIAKRSKSDKSDVKLAGAKQDDAHQNDDAAPHTHDAKAPEPSTPQPSDSQVKHDAVAEHTDTQKTAANAGQPLGDPAKGTEAKDDDSEAEKADEAKPAVAEAAEVTLPPFDQSAAKAALGAAATQASSCRKGDDPAGTAEVMITFAPSGRVTSANVAGGPFAGTATGGCVASTLRRAKVPAFSGAHVTVRKSVRVN